MAKNYTILIGTVGQGLNVSADGGESWTPVYQPIWHESNVRALCAVIPIMRSHRFFLHFRLRFRADFYCVSAEGAGLPFPVTEAFPAVRR